MPNQSYWKNRQIRSRTSDPRLAPGGSNACHTPSLGVKANDGKSTLSRIRNVSIVRILSAGARWSCTIGEHLLNGVVAGMMIKLHVADLCNLTQTEIGILGLQIHNELAHGYRQGAMVIFPLLHRRAKQAGHANFIESFRRSPQGAFCSPRLLSAFSRWKTMECNRANALIESLFWITAPLLDRLPVVGSLPSFSFRSCHACSPPLCFNSTSPHTPACR